LTIDRILLPAGEVAEGVHALLPALEFTRDSEIAPTDDVSAVELYVPPYLAVGPTLAMLPRLTGVRAVQVLTAGVDWIRPSMPADVVLCNARGVHDASTSELALAGILAMTKLIPQFVRLQDQATWGHQRVHGLAGSRAVILGYGAIGKAISRRLEAFDVDVVGVTSSGRDGTLPLTELDDVLAGCQTLILTLPLTAATAGLVDATMLSKLPDAALVVSIGRGPTVDHVALTAELESGRLRAMFDVTDPEPLPADSPLWHLPNVLVTPHVGGDCDLFPRFASALVAGQIERFLAGRPLEHQVTGQY
jgi:phosphoglycerate dehydrogenase-like enzyme